MVSLNWKLGVRLERLVMRILSPAPMFGAVDTEGSDSLKPLPLEESLLLPPPPPPQETSVSAAADMARIEKCLMLFVFMIWGGMLLVRVVMVCYERRGK